MKRCSRSLIFIQMNTTKIEKKKNVTEIVFLKAHFESLSVVKHSVSVAVKEMT